MPLQSVLFCPKDGLLGVCAVATDAAKAPAAKTDAATTNERFIPTLPICAGKPCNIDTIAFAWRIGSFIFHVFESLGDPSVRTAGMMKAPPVSRGRERTRYSCHQ